MIGKTYEIPLNILPVLMPLNYQEVKIELCLEKISLEEHILAQWLYGGSWIVSSISVNFLSLCEEICNKKSVLICTGDVDLDIFQISPIPVFYALFPAFDELNNFLMKKIACRELIRNIDLPPMTGEKKSGEIIDFVFENFPIEAYNPDSMESGLHTHLASAAIEKRSASVSVPVKSTKSALESVANSLCKKKKK